ncbi:MAG: GAF domain-containing sensor histidine kinase [Actinobacteria bacterium]|nr:GAF domain-containing sensor histidine kinase [Actinomycetota bacterium]
MDLKEAVDLYRDILRRYSQGFSIEEVLGVVAEALGGTRAALFARRDLSPFLELRMAWGVSPEGRKGMRDVLISSDWIEAQPARHYALVEKGKLGELGLQDLCMDAGDVLLLFPVKSHAQLKAALLVAIPSGTALPDQQSFGTAAVGAVLEKLLEMFSFEDQDGKDRSGEEPGSPEEGALTEYLSGRLEPAQAASLGLDLLIKLLNMDGGTVHRVEDGGGGNRAVLVASRGWGGMTEIIEHLFENRLSELLQAMRRAEEREFSLDAGRIGEFFPGVKPYFHANQVKSFLLTPIFQRDRLVGLLTLFGRAYTAMEPRDMELLVRLSRKLGELFSGEAGGEAGLEGVLGGERDFPALVEQLTRVSSGAACVEDFLAAALRMMAAELGAAMAFSYYREPAGEETAETFQWYAESVYGGESLFRNTAGVKRVAEHLERMAVVKPGNPALREMPASDQAVLENLSILLVPARDAGAVLVGGYYLRPEMRLTKAEMDSLQPMTTVVLGLARGLSGRAQAERYRASLEALTEIEEELSACCDPEQALRVIARGGRELLGCDRAAIMVYDEEGGALKGAVDAPETVGMEDLGFLSGRGMALALERGHALCGTERVGEEVDGESVARSYISVPLIGRKGKMGALVFEKFFQEGFFQEFHRRLAHFLAGQAVAALESRREGIALENTLSESESLLGVFTRLPSSQTLEDMCERLHEELAARMDVDLLLVSAYGKAGIRRVALFKGRKEENGAFDELLDAKGPLMLTVTRAGRLVRNNLNSFLRGPGEDELAMKGVRSYMAVELRGEDLQGVMLVGSSRGGAFGEREAALVERVAGIVGSFIGVPLRHDAMRGRIRLLEEMCRTQEERVKAKTDLINMASHEIRHPLTLIMGFSEVMRDYGESMDAEESREVAAKLVKAADRLRRSVVNMMEISRLESGKLSLVTEEVDLRVLLAGLRDELQARSSQHALEIRLEPGAERIFADRDKLEIVLFNLMENALKYSPPGSLVEVFARRDLREAVLGVRDEGQGISEENIKLIFQPFRRAEESEAGSVKGMGLGLYIVSRLVEAQGGRIEVSSEHGRGSTFLVRLPQPELGAEGSRGEAARA